MRKKKCTKNVNLKVFALLVNILIALPAFSQAPFSFESIDITNGLSDNQALCIHQDKEGFIWIGTMNGLNRFDGRTIKIFSQSLTDNNKLFNQRITKIEEDNYGNLWLDGFGGLIQLFNKKSHSIRNFPIQFGYYPKRSNSAKFLHDDGFAVLAFKDLGVFVIDIKNDNCNVLGSYMFDDEQLKNDTYIKSIYATDANNIWLNTRSGIVYLKIDPNSGKEEFNYLVKTDLENNSISKYYRKDSSLHFDVEGKGLVTYQIETGKIKLLEIIEGIDLRTITCIDGNNDKLWISTRKDGVIGISAENKKLLYHINIYKGKTLGYIAQLFIDSKGAIWFHSANFQGVFRFAPNKNKMDFYPFNFSKSERHNKSKPLLFFSEDRNGNIWIGPRKDGLFYYDRKSNSAIKISNNPQNSKSLISNQLNCICIDRSDNIWIGTEYGISRTSIREKVFGSLRHNKTPDFETDNRTDAIFEDSYGNIWCGKRSGEIYIYDKLLNLKHTFSENNRQSGFKYANCFSFKEDSKGRLWIGSKGEGLFMLDLKKYHNNLENTRFVQFMPNNSNKYSIHGKDIYDIIEDSKQRIWVAMYDGGLDLILDKESGFEFMAYNQFLEPFCPFTIRYGRCLLEDKSGKIWYGGVNGLCNFSVRDKDNSPFNVDFYYFDQKKRNTISYNDIKSLYEESDGTIWIGTYGGGINSFQPDTKKFQQFSTDDGLVNNIVFGIINDSDGNLWISTKNGLSKYNPGKNKFTNFTVADGLQTNEFTEAKPFESNGELFFGDIRGVTYFKSENIKFSEPLPEILFTDLMLANKKLEVSSEGPLKTDINLAKEINLHYNQNSFSISYSTANYRSQGKNRFEYILENFDDEWLQTKNNQDITYTNIQPGNYILRLKLINSFDDNIFKEKILNINITPPYWKTTWAYSIYGLLIISILIFSLQLFRKFNSLRNSLRLEKEITDFKLKFFTNISHELRTPLTLIINPIKELFNETDKNSDKGKGLMEIAFDNANNLLKLVNEILDFRKLQTKNIKLEISEREVVLFFKHITDGFKFVARGKDISYDYFCNVSEKMYWFDAEKTEKIVINLLTNAFKFTAPKGKINVSLFAESEQFSITVEDTGKGFDTDKRDKIFNRFYKAESEHRSFFNQGAGIGLSIVDEFVKLHKGNIDLFSEPGKGTKFIITLPGNKESYTKTELSQNNSWVVGTESDNYIKQFYPRLETTKNQEETKHSSCILIVEDNTDLLLMLKQKLASYFNVITAHNGEEGLNAVEEFTPNLIISDVLMPVKDGIEMTKELKDSFGTCHIPIIMLTAKSATEDKIEGYETGADAYITKPFEFEVIIARINNLLEQRKILKQKFSNDIHFDSGSVAIDKRDHEFIEKVVSVVIENLDNSEFNLDDIYHGLGYGKSVFYKKIKALTDCKPGEFVRTIKLKEAAKLLKTTNLNINEVAYKIGYSNVNNFRNQFKKQFNKTPSEFLKGELISDDLIVHK
jgi:signal transduction histidine kinase/ligand-binding sensor domain-containing protein/DNA-binding response OmpR family regulator